MSPLGLVLSVVVFVGFSAVCSGLNVSLMSLDLADLERKAKLGNVAARRVLPLRRKTHLTLAGLLLTNVAAVAATSLTLENEFNGIVAGIMSTLLIVIFGEIFPQAIFASRALSLTAAFAPLLKAMIFVTYPVSKPLQLLLDRLFRRGPQALQSRHELGIMISEHLGNTGSELDEDEVEIIRGALQLSEKRVRDIMTDIKNTYWLTPETVIDSGKISEIKAHGWSRIPVFNKHRTTCFGILLMKDLIDVNFEQAAVPTDSLPLYPAQVVGSMTALDTLFRKFIGSGVHLIPVERDDKIVGIVTIEDLLEEIVGREIEDETDRHKRRRLKVPHLKKRKTK